MITTFDDQWEVMPAGRTKVIHSQGVHCQFELKVSDNSYTGLLAQGNQAGIIRMGAAQNLDGGVMFPGIGVKFLRTGQKSANFVALRSTGPGGSMNFFADKLTNHVAPPAALVALHKFDQASGCTTMVGLSDVASYSQSGEKVSSPLFPFELEFEPSQEAQATMTDEKQTNDSLLNSLANIKPGTKLFDVYAVGSPSEAKQGTKKLLGTLTTTSECVRSTFGDEHMYFRHQRMEEDFAIRTEWIEQMKELSDTPAGSICKATTGPISKWQCPQGH